MGSIETKKVRIVNNETLMMFDGDIVAVNLSGIDRSGCNVQMSSKTF